MEECDLAMTVTLYQNNIAAKLFGKRITAEDDAETELSVYDVNEFACVNVNLRILRRDSRVRGGVYATSSKTKM